MDGDPANVCRVYYLSIITKNIATGSSLFAVPIVLPA